MSRLAEVGNLMQLLGLSRSGTGSQTTTTQTKLSKEEVLALINNILGQTGGLASVASGQKSAGLYNSSVNTQMINDLMSRVSTDVAAKAAPTVQSTKTTAPKQQLNLQGIIGTVLAKKAYDKLGGYADEALKGLGDVFSSSASGIPQGALDAANSAADPIDALNTITGGFSDYSGLADIASSAADTFFSGMDGMSGISYDVLIPDFASGAEAADAFFAGTDTISAVTDIASEAAGLFANGGRVPSKKNFANGGLVRSSVPAGNSFSGNRLGNKLDIPAGVISDSASSNLSSLAPPGENVSLGSLAPAVASLGLAASMGNPLGFALGAFSTALTGKSVMNNALAAVMGALSNTDSLISSTIDNTVAQSTPVDMSMGPIGQSEYGTLGYGLGDLGEGISGDVGSGDIGSPAGYGSGDMGDGVSGSVGYGDSGEGSSGDGGEGSGGGSGGGGSGSGGDGGGGDGYKNGGKPAGKLPGHDLEGRDNISINVSGGEYIVPTDVVDIMGQQFFDRLVELYHKPL